jgi:hypothetical protein
MKLTADDRLDIIELPGRYADALDTRRPEQLREVFTVDAVWEVVDALRLEGLDAIMAFMGRDDVHPGAHIMTNIYIASVEVQSDASPLVRLSSRGIYPVGPSDRMNPTAVFYGRYDDDIVLTDAGWRIRHRRYRYGV